MQTIVRANQGDTVDLICWRYYGRTGRVTERVYEANPGLCELGPILPHGHPVTLPALETSKPITKTLQLWE